MYGTCEFSYSDICLIDALITVLHKMHQADRIEVKLSQSLSYALCTSSRSFHWQKLPNAIKLRLLGTIHGNTNQFALLQDYGGDRDGRVWLVALYSAEARSVGQLAVLKFSKLEKGKNDDTKKEALNREGKVWNAMLKKLNVKLGVTPHVIPVCNHHALLIPFVFTATVFDDGVQFVGPDRANPQDFDCLTDLVDRHQELKVVLSAARSNPLDVAARAIQQLYEAGYVHNDLHWRHVGIIVYEMKEKLAWKPICIDLTDVKSRDEVDFEALKEAQLYQLQESLDARTSRSTNQSNEQSLST